MALKSVLRLEEVGTQEPYKRETKMTASRLSARYGILAYSGRLPVLARMHDPSGCLLQEDGGLAPTYPWYSCADIMFIKHTRRYVHDYILLI